MKNSIFRAGRVQEIPINKGKLLKKGQLRQFEELGGGGTWRKRGGLTPQCTLWRFFNSAYIW